MTPTPDTLARGADGHIDILALEIAARRARAAAMARYARAFGQWLAARWHGAAHRPAHGA